ncbi:MULTISPECIES: hypothetical protein [Halocynthiibacter]|uniref:Uncharacterized protein n=1 Tax=Halocynthiibacter halioticoli TaxID=2986804 RepID=A0AAE3LU75_9RHOB|nr:MULTISPECIES: hypothetical protein [Halocynthiibacter]MCV6823095.1 hypothetical protein [Halocynthiibacter halioticoli]MCW4056096.1 hypothetical protein [Halocynthiibacter sp. SDUM655004]
MTREIHVNDSFQTDYVYLCIAEPGENFDPAFRPFHTPKQMLELGVFEGKYINDCQDEFPEDWFEMAKIADKPSVQLNYFGIKSRQPLSVWKQKGWIYGPDPRGWFQWYCRYYMGRRLENIDSIQIKRWKSFARHAGQIKSNCHPNDLFCRPKQRQALLQWAYDPFI